jgi:HD superfamily phosphohydrolase
MRLADLGEHESQIADWLADPELALCIAEDWGCDRQTVVDLLRPEAIPKDRDTVTHRFLASCLSGPIDVDKLDYLHRDSLHAGVPYGRNFDAGRLISSMCPNPRTSLLAVGEKGRTAAEMMVFARYVMFSEVYWHHAVRSATAMLQRCVFLLQNRIDLQSTLRLVDSDWIAMLRRAAEGSVAEPLAEGLFGSRRCLYKRVAEFNVIDGFQVHRTLARRPYWWLVACAEQIAGQLSRRTGLAVHAADVLIDAPPVKLEVDINMDVVARDGTVRRLGDVSPVASSLAEQQFDAQVKKVRVFVRGDLRDPLGCQLNPSDWDSELMEASHKVEQELV